MIDSKELWRQIPPEEKLELMSRAQSKGVLACLSLICLAATLSIGFQTPQIFWASFLGSPIVFQASASKAWKALRPRAMLEYLGVRSAARRFAFSVDGEDLTVNLMFRGRIEHLYGEEQVFSALNAAVEGEKEAAVWITLFQDSLVMISEKPGGAKLEFGTPLKTLEMQVQNEGGETYSSDKEIVLSMDSRKHGKKSVRLTSHQPAALVVFEKKVLQLKEEAAILERGITALIPDVPPVLSS